MYAGDSAAEYTDRIGPTWSNGYGGGVSLSGSATLINNTFTDNIAAGHNRGGGGGVHVYGSATVTKNRFTNNAGPVSCFGSSSLDSEGGWDIHKKLRN